MVDREIADLIYAQEKDLVYFTIRVPDTSDKSVTRTTRVRNEWRECYANDTSVTQVTKFGFDNDTSENILSYLYISYAANERLQGEKLK